MLKKFLLLVVLIAGVLASVFARDFQSMAKNTITVDIGPTIVGGSLGIVDNFVGEDTNTSGFGIGAQYERQLLKQLSVAGRFAYLRASMGLSTANDEYELSDIRFSSYSIEAHARFYPLGEVFFLNGMLGFANMKMAADEATLPDNVPDVVREESLSFSASRNYFKLGAKVGWRINFGLRSGPILEPSFGYYGAVGAGSSLADSMADIIKEDFSDKYVNMLQNFIFVGGPRLSINLGWRF